MDPTVFQSAICDSLPKRSAEWKEKKTRLDALIGEKLKSNTKYVKAKGEKLSRLMLTHLFNVFQFLID